MISNPNNISSTIKFYDDLEYYSNNLLEIWSNKNMMSNPNNISSNIDLGEHSESWVNFLPSDSELKTNTDTSITLGEFKDTAKNKYKYGENEVFSKLIEYIDSTYNQHYVGKDGIQTFDVWESMEIAEENCLGVAIKYLMRYGRKDGYNKKDLLKAMHYIILLWHYTNDKE